MENGLIGVFKKKGLVGILYHVNIKKEKSMNKPAKLTFRTREEWDEWWLSHVISVGWRNADRCWFCKNIRLQKSDLCMKEEECTTCIPEGYMGRKTYRCLYKYRYETDQLLSGWDRIKENGEW
jgi:hypothetical protein